MPRSTNRTCCHASDKCVLVHRSLLCANLLRRLLRSARTAGSFMIGTAKVVVQDIDYHHEVHEEHEGFQSQTSCSSRSSWISKTQLRVQSWSGYSPCRLAYKGQTTLPLAYNASAATVDAALESLSTLGASAVTVSLSGSVYTITFGGGGVASTNVNSLQGDMSTATYGTVSRTITTTYDAASQVTQVSDPSATIDTTRDGLGRATSIVNTIAGLTPAITFDQVFSAAGDRTQLKAKIASTNDFKTDYSYDTLGRLTDLDHKQGGTVLASYDYTFDYGNRFFMVSTSCLRVGNNRSNKGMRSRLARTIVSTKISSCHFVHTTTCMSTLCVIS